MKTVTRWLSAPHRGRSAALASALLFTLGSAVELSAKALEVWVSIQPQRFVVERIGGDLVSCQVLVGPGQSPATYETTPHQLAGLETSGRFIRIGVPFEASLVRKISSAFPDLQIVDGRQGIPLHEPPPSSGTAATHPHHHHGPDPHFWLDPSLLSMHAERVFDALAAWLPDHRVELAARLHELTAELDAVDLELRRTLAPFSGRSFIVYHPAFGYFARRYGLQEVAVEADGKAPGPRELTELIDQARQHHVHTVFVQRQFSHRTAVALAEAIGAEVVDLDPLAADYPDNLRRMARAIADSYLTTTGNDTHD